MFDVYLPGHICPNGNRLAAALGNLIHYSVGSFFTGSIVDNDGCAFGSELFGDVSADSLRRACHERDFSVQFSIFHFLPFKNCLIHCLHLCEAPSTNNSVPVMYLLSSDARKTTALAISSGVPS